jgi:arsenical resistance protein ArsH
VSPAIASTGDFMPLRTLPDPDHLPALDKRFFAVNTLRMLGRWMRMLTIPNQSSVANAFQEFDDNGRMTPSDYDDRIASVMEELVRLTMLTRPHAAQLVDRYSERKAAALKRDPTTDRSAITAPPKRSA